MDFSTESGSIHGLLQVLAKKGIVRTSWLEIIDQNHLYKRLIKIILSLEAPLGAHKIYLNHQNATNPFLM